jgi:ketosteroid isomerase-like protein
MPRENVEVVKRIYGLGPAAVEELWHPDVVVEERADFPDSATYHGYEGLREWWAGMLDVYDRIALTPRRFFSSGDRVVAEVDHHLESKTGVPVEYHGAHVWTVRDGRVVHVTGYSELADALERAGLSEDDVLA